MTNSTLGNSAFRAWRSAERESPVAASFSRSEMGAVRWFMPNMMTRIMHLRSAEWRRWVVSGGFGFEAEVVEV